MSVESVIGTDKTRSMENNSYLKVADEVKSQSEMDKDAFINLLVTQMKYQDPLEPMDNSQMLAQLAQFSALEQMMNVANVSTKQLANGMIGEYVEYRHDNPDTGNSEYRIGKVDYVKTSGDTPIIGIGGNEVKIDQIYQVFDSSNMQANSTAFELLGKTVQGIVKEKNAEGVEEDIIIEGEVLGIEMKDGDPYMVIGSGSKKVVIAFENVQSVVEKPSITGKTVTGTYKDKEGKTQTITGIAEYIKIQKSGTLVYVKGESEGIFIEFDNISEVKN